MCVVKLCILKLETGGLLMWNSSIKKKVFPITVNLLIFLTRNKTEFLLPFRRAINGFERLH